MDSSKYGYVNEDQINSEMICSICLSPFIDPCCTPCRETFCRQCITQWFQEGKNTCPLCRINLSLNDLTPASHMVRSLLDGLLVKCLACKQTGLQRGQFQTHLERTCPKTVVSSSSINTNLSSTGANAPGLQPNTIDTHQHVARRDSTLNLPFIVIALSVLILIIFYRSGSETSLSKPAKLSENDPIAMPILCSNISQCPSQQIPFEDSQLLTDEHQHYLNYFYNHTTSHLSKWNVIYRGSRDGFNAPAFHAHCDNKGETLIVLSTTKGYLFGGYTDTNWTTPSHGFPTYGRSTKAFLFSLISYEKRPARKFFLDTRHQNYATVSDFLSGPIFGAMTRPDIGVFYTNGEFRCQINFPSLYKGAVTESSFPTSDDCIINEMEVFVPVFKKRSSMAYAFFKQLFGLIVTAIACIAYLCVSEMYNDSKQSEARFWAGLCLCLLWINYLWGFLILLALVFSIILCIDWNKPSGSPVLDDLRTEKRYVMSSVLVLLTYIILFY